MTSLLGSAGPHSLLRSVPEERLLLDLATGVDESGLAFELRFEGALHRRKGVHVLDFGLGAKLRLAGRAHANVGVDSETPLFHTDVADVEILKYLLQSAQIRAGAG